MTIKFTDLKWKPTHWIDERFTDDGIYKKNYLENTLAELYALQKLIDRDIKIAKQKLELLKQGRLKRYMKYEPNQ